MPPSPTKKKPKAPGRAQGSTRELLKLRGPSRRQLSRHRREQLQRRAMLIGGLALLAIIVGVLGYGYWRENIGRAQETVAVIFGERITAADLLEQARPQLLNVDRQIAFYRGNGLTQQAAQLQFRRSQVAEDTLNDIVEDRVVRREAANRGITVSPDEVDAKIRQDIATSDAASQPQPTPTPAATAPPGTTPSATPTPRHPDAATDRHAVPTLTDDRFGPAEQQYLSATGQTEAELRHSTEFDLYDRKLREAVGQEVPAIQEQIHARHIVFKSEDDANAALQQLQGGASFEELAASQSQDRDTKDKGGDLGWLPRLERDLVFDDTLFALQPGQLSGVVQTGNGWEIIQALERDPARPVAPDQLSELRRRHYGDWLALAEGNPEIDRHLTPEQSDWILQHAASKRP